MICRPGEHRRRRRRADAPIRRVRGAGAERAFAGGAHAPLQIVAADACIESVEPAFNDGVKGGHAPLVALHHGVDVCKRVGRIGVVEHGREPALWQRDLIRAFADANELVWWQWRRHRRERLAREHWRWWREAQPSTSGISLLEGEATRSRRTNTLPSVVDVERVESTVKGAVVGIPEAFLGCSLIFFDFRNL